MKELLMYPHTFTIPITKLFNDKKKSINYSKNVEKLEYPPINKQNIIKTNNQDSTIIQKNNELNKSEEYKEIKDKNLNDATDKSLKISSNKNFIKIFISRCFDNLSWHFQKYLNQNFVNLRTQI